MCRYEQFDEQRALEPIANLTKSPLISTDHH